MQSKKLKKEIIELIMSTGKFWGHRKLKKIRRHLHQKGRRSTSPIGHKTKDASGKGVWGQGRGSGVKAATGSHQEPMFHPPLTQGTGNEIMITVYLSN